METSSEEGDCHVSESESGSVMRNLSRAGHEEPCLNLGRPRSKAKYRKLPIVQKYREGKAKRTPEGE